MIKRTTVFLWTTMSLLMATPKVQSFLQVAPSCHHGGLQNHLRRSECRLSLTKGEYELPRVIVFDLDGCLWSPEMYEINYFMGGRGAPFSLDPTDSLNLLTAGGEPVKLLGDVRAVMRDLYTHREFENVTIGISSRTDEPKWARELLQKFKIAINANEYVSLNEIFNGPIEIAKDSKVAHFSRIVEQCNVDMEDVLFFDNEYGNCQSVAKLGVSVVYCPDGVTQQTFDMGVRDFPRKDGTVIGSRRG
mmetsp:Transcript_49134/g.84462  ORF Transcript_49134/g.84462 Transcript_49134/m.84462 type:complete len:247 (-) Transcript_49134:17-757(-)